MTDQHLIERVKTAEGRELDALAAEYVMGIAQSANTDKEVSEAVFDGFTNSWSNGTADFTWNGHEYPRLPLIKTDWWNCNDDYGWHLWENRHRKPYQEDIEKHVAAWRKIPPKKYHKSLDTAAQLEAEIERRGLKCDYVEELSGEIVGRTLPECYDEGWNLLRATAAQRARASILTVLKAKEDGKE